MITITQPEVKYPILTFQYSWKSRIIDFIGGLIWKSKVSVELKNKLYKQLPHLVKTWESEAPLLFGEVFSLFNRGFQQEERVADVYLSNCWSYGSNRFLILSLQFLQEDSCALYKSREDSFTSLVFHELLHVWVDENIDKEESSLLKKYCKDGVDVRDHIHLMAIQKAVYLALNRSDIVHILDKAYRTVSPLSYKRAWEIVNDIEGYKAVLQDIEISLTQ